MAVAVFRPPPPPLLFDLPPVALLSAAGQNVSPGDYTALGKGGERAYEERLRNGQGWDDDGDDDESVSSGRRLGGHSNGMSTVAKTSLGDPSHDGESPLVSWQVEAQSGVACVTYTQEG